MRAGTFEATRATSWVMVRRADALPSYFDAVPFSPATEQVASIAQDEPCHIAPVAIKAADQVLEFVSRIDAPETPLQLEAGAQSRRNDDLIPVEVSHRRRINREAVVEVPVE